MKTIYTSDGRFRLSDEIHSLVDEAAKEVYNLSSRHDWSISIKMGVPGNVFKAWRHSKYFKGYDPVYIRVEAIDVKDDVHTKVPRADLGVYVNNVWKSLIYNRNLLTLPEVFFFGGFAQGLIGELSLTKRVIQMIDDAHWQTLAGLLYQEAKDWRESASSKKAKDQKSKMRYEQERGYYKRVMEASCAYSKSGEGLEELINTLKSKPK